MFGRFIGRASKFAVRHRHTKPNSPIPCDYSKVDKVTICGALNPLGQYLAFLLKRQEIIREIALYDDCNVRGLALDLEHMNTKCRVKPNSGECALKDALRHSDIIVITNGYESNLDESEEAIRRNAQMMYKYGVKIASICPEAFICIITPPVNIMVPLFSEVMKVCNVYDPNKIFGVCSLMEMRANSIVADYLNIDPAAVRVPIVGGVSPTTCVPLLSHAKPYGEFSYTEMRQLINTIFEVSDDCKKLQTNAPLSTAFALSRFILTLSAGLCTCDCAIQTAFIRSNVVAQVKYFASEIQIGIKGAVANMGLPKVHDYELDMLSRALVCLENDINKAYCLFNDFHRAARADEIEDICRPTKPFIIKTPCPPCPPCIPTEVCQPKIPEHPCASTASAKKAKDSRACSCSK
ncbi:hypothetical protein RUM43_003674 [Polyplax serrata]|uniref:Malate dehydrogenase, mitochondrial n=1 Tax=Polyplax serrata TaxID=468196 RepID=A0AAN8Q1M0_POLSC